MNEKDDHIPDVTERVEKSAIEHCIATAEAALGPLATETVSEARKELAEMRAKNTKLVGVLQYFLTYYRDGVGQLTHAIAYAEAALKEQGNG